MERKSEKLSVYLRLKGTCGQLKLEDFDEVIKFACNIKKKKKVLIVMVTRYYGVLTYKKINYFIVLYSNY